MIFSNLKLKEIICLFKSLLDFLNVFFVCEYKLKNVEFRRILFKFNLLILVFY